MAGTPWRLPWETGAPTTGGSAHGRPEPGVGGQTGVGESGVSRRLVPARGPRSAYLIPNSLYLQLIHPNIAAPPHPHTYTLVTTNYKEDIC